MKSMIHLLSNCSCQLRQQLRKSRYSHGNLGCDGVTSFLSIQGKLIPAVFGHVFSELTTDISGLVEQQILSSEFNQVSAVL